MPTEALGLTPPFAADLLRNREGTSRTWPELRAYYKLSATISGTFLKALRAIVYPADSAADGHSLIVKNSTLQADELDASVDRTVAAMNADIAHVNSADDTASASANLIRGDLGLPPIPVS